ncbi:hypothetical protein J2Z48_002179 [Croceifilum oryzae]|uniref:Uncharacterized protein n=1 Tax=Croceifilum oryzae TaxID=1553429 RepID=A0AAJ1TFH9_9BACL|nr:hypothetical protein [Croceifilum oryzae]MDQ0417995.1 hypothetical protein [Croceifilum oryzae]
MAVNFNQPLRGIDHRYMFVFVLKNGEEVKILGDGAKELMEIYVNRVVNGYEEIVIEKDIRFFGRDIARIHFGFDSKIDFVPKYTNTK